MNFNNIYTHNWKSCNNNFIPRPFMNIQLRYLNLWTRMNANNFMKHCKYVWTYWKSLNKIIKIFENQSHHENPWTCMTINNNHKKQNQWTAMTIHQNHATLWKSITIHQHNIHQWKAMTINERHGNQRKSRIVYDIYENQWQSITINDKHKNQC